MTHTTTAPARFDQTPGTARRPAAGRRLARVVSADLAVLRRPALLFGTYAAVAVVTALVTALTFATAGGNSSGAGPSAQGATVGDLESATGALSGLSSGVSILGVIALCVAAAHVAGMFSSGTIRNVLVRSPGRVVLVLGKAAAVSLFLLGAVVVATVSAVLAAYICAPIADVDTSAWGTSVAAIVAEGGQVALAVVGYGLIGTCLGLAVRASVPAIAIGIGWLLPIETLVSVGVDGSDRWLPGQLLSTVASGGTDEVALGAALLTLTGYLVVGLGYSTTRFARGDVTS